MRRHVRQFVPDTLLSVCANLLIASFIIDELREPNTLLVCKQLPHRCPFSCRLLLRERVCPKAIKVISRSRCVVLNNCPRSHSNPCAIDKLDHQLIPERVRSRGLSFGSIGR